MINFSKRSTRVLSGVSLVGTCVIGVYLANRSRDDHYQSRRPRYDKADRIIVPSFPRTKPREEQIMALKESANDKKKVFDLLIIGGGATGTGIALDAVTRGLKVALVDAADFGSGTSSKSTKLIHGGVRYLEKAFWELDYGQYKLVKEALRERSSFISVAPHLTAWMPIMIPIQKWWEAPYLWAGTKAYDLLSGFAKNSYYMSKTATLQAFPNLDKSQVLGSLVYYDGLHNDSRMNVSLAMTAAAYGATIANYVEVTRLSVGADGKLDGVCVKNRIPNIDNKLEEFSIEARGVINATGPFTDSIRQMAKEQVEDIVAPSSGTHIVLPAHFGPSGLGLLDPATSDGRVLFFLPWLGHIIAGTTDEACDITKDPTPKGSEVDWILRETNRYMQSGIQIQRSDVLSAWTGIRPLVRDPSKAKSEGLVRNHLITKSGNGLITIAGGKWTTYRQMAEEAVDEAIADFGLASYASRDTTLPSICSTQELEPLISPDGSCKTLNLKLIGAHGWDSNLHINLAQTYGLDSDVAMHLTTAYGDRAWQVASLCTSTFARCNGSRLTPRLPFIDGEIVHAIRSEYAQTVVDVVSRRMRLAFLDTKAALNVLPKIEDIMGQELGWSAERREMEHSNAIQYLKTMGLDLIVGTAQVNDNRLV